MFTRLVGEDESLRQQGIDRAQMTAFHIYIVHCVSTR